MASNEKGRICKSLKTFVRTALASTCLTAMAGGLAVAGTVSYDDDNVSPGEFGITYSSSMLAAATGGPVNTTIISGHICNTAGGACTLESTTDDHLEVTGLIGGQSVNLSDTATGPATFKLLDDTLTFIGSIPTNGSTPFTVPNDGNLLFDVEIGSESSSDYTITATQTTGVPEPSTVSGAALALAGALLLRRNSKKA